MAQDRLEEIERRLDQISPFPWHDRIDGDGNLRVDNDIQQSVCWFGDMEETEGIDHAQAEFVAHAPQDIRWLLDEVNRLQREVERFGGVRELATKALDMMQVLSEELEE